MGIALKAVGNCTILASNTSFNNTRWFLMDIVESIRVPEHDSKAALAMAGL